MTPARPVHVLVAEAIGDELAAAYRQDKEFPESLDGMGTLSDGNEIGR